MALVVLMEQVSAGTESEATGHFTLPTIYKGVPYLYYLSERRGLVVKKLDYQTYNWGFEPKETHVKFLGAQFKFKDLDLEYFLFR